MAPRLGSEGEEEPDAHEGELEVAGEEDLLHVAEGLAGEVPARGRTRTADGHNRPKKVQSNEEGHSSALRT